MKVKLILACLLCSLFYFGYPQNERQVDSLTKILERSADDTVKVRRLITLAKLLVDKDSSIQLLETAKAISEKIHYNYGLSRSNHYLGYYHFAYKQELDKAFSNFSAAKMEAEQMRDTMSWANNLNFEGIIYATQANCIKAEKTFQQEEALLLNIKTIGDKHWYLTSLANNYMAYSNLYQQMDSTKKALPFIREALELAPQLNDESFVGSIVGSMGLIQSRLGEHDSAILYFTRALQISKNIKSNTAIAFSLAEIGLQYNAKGDHKKGLEMADSALQLANRYSLTKEKLDAFNILTTINRDSKNFEQALIYTDSAILLKEKILSQETAAKIAVTETKYEEELEREKREKEKQAEETRKNIQMAGIIVFIITFFLFIVLISRRKAYQGIAKFMGIIALLFSFEFISLFIHPFIEKTTHDSPVYMLLILVGIAAFLVPFHHRVEKWIKNKLTHIENPPVETAAEAEIPTPAETDILPSPKE